MKRFDLYNVHQVLNLLGCLEKYKPAGAITIDFSPVSPYLGVTFEKDERRFGSWKEAVDGINKYIEEKAVEESD